MGMEGKEARLGGEDRLAACGLRPPSSSASRFDLLFNLSLAFMSSMSFSGSDSSFVMVQDNDDDNVLDLTLLESLDRFFPHLQDATRFPWDAQRVQQVKQARQERQGNLFLDHLLNLVDLQGKPNPQLHARSLNTTLT